MRDFRFSFNVRGVESRAAFEQQCRDAEQQGYDTVFAADHLGAPAPFPLLVAAAEATERMRVGTLMLNAAFWNPALLAREVATTDVLTDGRLEVGLGAGHMKWEFDESGIAWKPFGVRAEALRSMISELRRFFHADFPARPEGVTPPRPVQRHGFDGTGPPLIVGGTGDRILRIAAEHADIVSETPYLLIGTTEEMAGQLLDHRERYGFSYLTVHEPFRETFAPVIELLRR